MERLHDIGMTVGELKQRIKNVPDDMEVVIGIWSRPIHNVSVDTHRYNSVEYTNLRISYEQRMTEYKMLFICQKCGNQEFVWSVFNHNCSKCGHNVGYEIS